MRALLVLAVAGMALAVSAANGASRSACYWRAVSGVPGTQLAAVSAVSDKGVWAVGMNGSQWVVLHWNGRGWRMTRSPVVALDVDAVSARDVWVVGESSPRPSAARPLSMHWDGARWKVVPVPGPRGALLRAVSGVWAVGTGRNGPLVVRWNGRAWRAVPTGVPNGLLHAVDGRWAVGTRGTGSEEPLVVQLRGGQAQKVATPSIDSVDENLLGVDAVSSHEVWAVGSADVLGGRSPLVQHLDGGVWRDESVDGLPSSEAALTAVAAFGPPDVWVAGYHGFSNQRTLLAHWDGSRWNPIVSRAGTLSDLSAVWARDIWAVGEAHVARGTRSLVEHYSCD